MHEFNKNRQAIYKLTYHLVVVTKYRHPCINENIKIGSWKLPTTYLQSGIVQLLK